jgi:hypothetical protein
MRSGVWVRIASHTWDSWGRIEGVELEVAAGNDKWAGCASWWVAPPLFPSDVDRLREWDGEGECAVLETAQSAIRFQNKWGRAACDVFIEDGANRVRLAFWTELAAIDRFRSELVALERELKGEASLWVGVS